jgi:hypothetical protein
LNIDLNVSSTSKPRTKYYPNDDEAPADEWRPIAIEFAKECKEVLWSETGKNALAWLRNRGLTDETINRAGLGYNPATHWDEKDAWAIGYRKEIKKVWIPRGIVIPWVIERQLWKVSIRRPDPDIERDRERGIEHPAKYVSIAGGSNGLYGIDTFNYERPAVIVEGEFDKLILSQVVGSEANVFATGSTAKGRGEKWALLIAQSPTILIAYDADEGGEKAMREYWLKYLPQALPWQPWAKDINAMYLEGQDLHEWLRMGVELAQPSPIEEPISIVNEPLTNPIEEPDEIPVVAEQESVAELKPSYSPVSLPPLPRKVCPCRTLGWNKDGSQIKQPCRGKATENGFCEDHRLSYEFLEIGAQLGYPEMVIPFRWKGETRHRTIYEGVECWEERACIVHTDRPQMLKENVDYLRRKFAAQLREEVAV